MAKIKQDKAEIQDCKLCVNSFYYEGMLVCSMRIKDVPTESSIVDKKIDCSFFKVYNAKYSKI